MKATPLNPILTQELKILGQYLRALRIKQTKTLKDLGMRINADPRTVGKIERGDPSVSLEILIAYLNILGLSDGLSERILGEYLSIVKQPKRNRMISNKDLGYE